METSQGQRGSECGAAVLPGTTSGRSGQVPGRLQLAGVEEGADLVGQLGQDALSERHAVPLRSQRRRGDSKTHKSSAVDTGELLPT